MAGAADPAPSPQPTARRPRHPAVGEAGLLPGPAGRSYTFWAGDPAPLAARALLRAVRMTVPEVPPTIAVKIFSAGAAACVADVITFALWTPPKSGYR